MSVRTRAALASLAPLLALGVALVAPGRVRPGEARAGASASEVASWRAAWVGKDWPHRAGRDGGVAAPARAASRDGGVAAPARPASRDGGTPSVGPQRAGDGNGDGPPEAAGAVAIGSLDGGMSVLSPGVAGLGLETGLGTAAPVGQILWAGHQVVLGERRVPIFGKVRTRSESFFLAKVRHDGNRWKISPVACAARFDRVAGVRVTLPDAVSQRLPVVPFLLGPSDDGWYYAKPWASGWGRQDLDGDGHPGVTFHAHSFFCSGETYVSSWSQNLARARPRGSGWVGQIRIRLEQKTLGTSSGCLRWGAQDAPQELHGTFAYTRVPLGTTCADLLAAPRWPVRAPEPKRK